MRPSRRNSRRLLRWTTKPMRELCITIRLRRNLLGDLLEMRSGTRRANYSIENYVGELLESTIASYRLGKMSAEIGSSVRSRVPISSDSRRRALPDETVRRVENLRFLLPATSIATRFRINKSKVIRILKAARRREELNRQGKFPGMRGLL